MAYDETLAERVEQLFMTQPGASKRKMFGGLCFMHNRHMCCGIVGDKFMVRIGPDAYEDALQEPHVTQMDITGKPMKGMVFVLPDGILDNASLARWIEKALAFTTSLPDKMPSGT